MLSLTNLSANGKAIADLTGLEHAVNLKWLSLYNNDIRLISSVSGLTDLEELTLGSNPIQDISPVSALTKLRELDLSYVGTSVSDLSPLARLTNLVDLSLEGNWVVSDISVLSGFADLEILYVASNQISDISPLLPMTNLRELDLRWNPLNRAAYCTYLPLILANNPGIWMQEDPNPDPGGECPVSFPDLNLKVAVEEQLGISDPMPSDMLGLTFLDGTRREIADLTGLEHAVNLSELLLSNNEISDISVISALANLRTLGLSANRIDDISVLATLTNLTHLELGGNRLNLAAYCTYLPLITTNNPSLGQMFYDSNPIDFPDFAVFALYWLETDCGACGGVDLTSDGNVDSRDLITRRAEFHGLARG